MDKDKKNLRWGYSTGACAAAVATAAWLRVQHENGFPSGQNLKQCPANNPASPHNSVSVLFLDGVERELPLLPTENAAPGCSHMAAILKNGGDDPDCTHGATLYADIHPCHIADAQQADYVLFLKNGTVVLRAVEGIGLCTRPGLDCEQGHWAINKGPRQMLSMNLERAGLTGCWLLELGVQNGAELARRTLNGHLGVEGGISILGTTGLVRPFSNEAYIHTIRICLRRLSLETTQNIHRNDAHTSAFTQDICPDKQQNTPVSGHVVFCTGGRTKAGAETFFPNLPSDAFINIADFIAESLAAACAFNMREITIACMPGKLCKYAAGFENTHADKSRQNMDLFVTVVRQIVPERPDLYATLETTVSVREALLSVPPEHRKAVLHQLAVQALDQFEKFCSGTRLVQLLLFDFDGTVLMEISREVHGRKTPAAQPHAAGTHFTAEIGARYFLEQL